jgi:xanthine dehydrogenase accessory factor
MKISELFTRLLAKTSAGADTMLVTVVAENGSSPRSAGAHMVVDKNGRVCGTVGGGPMEYKALDLARNLLQQRQSLCKIYRLRQNDDDKLGMLCGGDMELYFRYIGGGDEKLMTLMREAVALLKEDEDLWLFIDLTDGGMELHRTIRRSSSLGLSETDLQALAVKRAAVIHAVTATGPHRIYGEPVNSAGTAYIFGGGHVARALAPVLHTVDFRCAIFDNRAEFVTPAFFPTADALILGDYDRIGDSFGCSLKPGANDYIVIATYAHDRAVLRQLVTRGCAYIGLIGSKAKVAALQQGLLAEGFSAELLGGINAPIGLRIKSETPEEIAISIAGEMILRRAERRSAPEAASASRHSNG